MYRPRLKIFYGKWKSRCSGPFIVSKVLANGLIEVHVPIDLHTFTVKGKMPKIYSRGEIPIEKVSLGLAKP